MLITNSKKDESADGEIGEAAPALSIRTRR